MRTDRAGAGRWLCEQCAVQVSPDAFVFRDLTMRGFWLARWFQQTPEDARRALASDIAQLITTGALCAPIHATFDVSRIKERSPRPPKEGAQERCW